MESIISVPIGSIICEVSPVWYTLSNHGEYLLCRSFLLAYVARINRVCSASVVESFCQVLRVVGVVHFDVSGADNVIALPRPSQSAMLSRVIE